MTAPSRTQLRDGSVVVIRPLEPEDRDLIRAGFERLSDRSRYLRFQTPLTELSEQQLSYLTAVDHHDHEALVALDPDSDGAIGVARFVRVGDDVAECAIAVADDWQNRGLATQLLDRLVERAHQEGVERFTALVLADNTDALRLLERLGDTVRHSEGSQLELEIELPERPESSSSLRLILAGAARGLLVPAISMWRQVADFAHQHGRAEAVTEPANVIVAHAFTSAGDGPALTVVAGLAAARRAHVHLVESYWPLISDRDAVNGRLSAAADELRRQGVDVTAHLIGGDTVDAVIDVAAATDAALIVIDPRAAAGETPWRAYSLPSRVCARAPCDVLIARHAGNAAAA
ncbi:MAG TPA: GNAT family N-acetyltransferase [Solirubrobacteraceae bacterium]|nr:GNAT family N-acetyltransferase [Solirubrobacteraceae bacterium]